MGDDYNFWEEWKNKTTIEKKAIKSIKIAEKIILKNIPKKEIVAIYIKGSFVNREMNEKSDVDTSTILKNSKWLSKLIELDKKYREKFDPNIEFTGYSLWELKTNKRAKNGKVNRAAPNRAVLYLENYKLIYGKPLDKKDFHQGDNKKRLQSMITTFRTFFIPGYEKKEFSFSEIIKQVFWLIRDEQRFLGKNPSYSCKELDKSIINKNHIVHETLKLRLNPAKDEKEREKFMRKLNKYLSELDKLVKKNEN